MNQAVKMPMVALLWQSFGPYHLARLRACREALGEGKVVGLEISAQNLTYKWRRESTSDERIVSLFSGVAAEDVGAWQIYRRLREVIRREKIEVLFVPSYWPLSSVAAELAAWSMGIKVVLMSESHLLSGQNNLLSFVLKRQLIKRYDAALVGGRMHRGFFRQLGMSNDRIFEGYDIVDNSYFEHAAARARAHVPEHRFRLGLPPKYVLSLGRFVWKKNLPVVVKSYALARQAGRLNGHDLVFVGDGVERVALLAEARAQQLTVVERHDGTDRVLFGTQTAEVIRLHPFAQIETTPIYYALATTFILASRQEEWGLVVNEAMACGCPVLVSRVAGCSADLVVQGVSGYRINPENPAELAWRIGELCSDLTLASRLGAGAARHIQDWKPARFGENARMAALKTLVPKQAAPWSSASTPLEKKVTLLQTIFPDYREPVFDELNRQLDEQFELLTGDEYFTPDVKKCSEFKDWHAPARNSFLLWRSFLWQHGVIGRMCDADVAVLELNPRILSSWLILFMRKVTSAPVLVWGHAWSREGSESWTNVFRLLMMRIADVIIPYSLTQQRELSRYLPMKKIVAAPNSLIRREDCKSAPPPEGRRCSILYVGRLNPAKKPDLLLSAFAKVSQRLPTDVRLVIIGEGELRPTLEEMARRESLGGRVIFTGHVSDKDVLRVHYASAFCTVSPGYVGLNAIQSFAHGVPMLVAKGERHSPEIEACIPDVNSVFFPAGDRDALAEGLLAFWAHREIWERRREDIAAWTGTNYSVERMVEGFVAATKQVM